MARKQSRHLSRTLAFYIGKRFLSSVFLTTLVLGAFTFLIEMIEMTRRLGKNPDVDSVAAFGLVMLKLPDMLLEMTPFAVLIGTMICFSRMARNHELVAIRSSGLPARKFLIPPFLVCLAIGLFNITVFNPFSATTLKNYQYRINQIFPGSAEGLVVEGGKIWLKQKEQDIEILIYAQSAHNQGTLLKKATIFVFGGSGDFQNRYDMATMSLQNGQWLMSDVLVVSPKGLTQKVPQLYLKTTLTPEMIQNSFTSPKTLSVWELHKFIGLLKETGFPTTQHELQFQKMLSLPALIIAMFLLGAPFSLYLSREKGLGTLIVYGLCFGFSFYFFSNFIGAHGISGRINLTLSAWIPTLSASLIGLALFLHFREE